MHVPSKFKETNLDVLLKLVQAHPLGTWIVLKDQKLDVNHIPFYVDTTKGEFGILKGHVSVANPIWKSLSTASESKIVFQGPETYITPSWYQSKQDHGKVVPTWNYVVVHASGHPIAVRDESWLLAHLTELTDRQESSRNEPWAVSDAPEDFVAQMLKGIVGIQMPIESITGAWKTSQNRKPSDKRTVINGLTENGDSRSIEMAAYVAKHTQSN